MYFSPPLPHLNAEDWCLHCDFKMLSFQNFHYNQKNMKLEPGHIRLITLLPSCLSSDEKHVECVMHVVDLETEPKYEALSYAWGPPKRSRVILVNGQSLLVTQSVEVALRRLQQEDRSVILWVDQLCINQEDDDEKSVQVSMMSQIYAKSSQTVVWLGPAADGSDIAMDFLNQIGKEAVGFGLTQHPPDVYQNWSTSLVADDDPNKGMKLRSELLFQRVKMRWPLVPYAAFVRRHWFSRIWIIQEFSLPCDVSLMCGDREVTFRHFRAAELFIALYQSTLLRELHGREVIRRGITQEEYARGKVLAGISTGHISGLIHARQIRHKLNFDPQRKPLSLDRLLKRYQVALDDDTPRLDCKDPRDRIFGLLGIAEDADLLGIRPDYHKSYLETYTDTARKLIRAGYVDILAQSQFPKTILVLPSWVPDWASSIYEPIGDVQYRPIYKTSGGSKQKPQGDENFENKASPTIGNEQESAGKKAQLMPIDRMLHLNGTCVDDVETVGRIWGEDHDTKAFLEEIKSLCLRSQLKNKKIYKTESRRAEAEWRIPVADQELGLVTAGRATPRSERGYNLELMSNQMREDVHSGTVTTSTVQDFADIIYDPAHLTYAGVVNDMRNRRAYLTTQGYVGLGPVGMEVGDTICILFGANFPYVLRRSEDGGSYTFVGEAYCDGIMDGDFMETDPKEEVFNIY